MNAALKHHCSPKPEFGHEVGCALALPFRYLDGDSFMDRSVYGHLCTKTGALWRPYGHYFDGIDDVLNCGNAPILQTCFGGDTTGSYTYLWWQRQATSSNANRGIFNKGADPNFWGVWLSSNGRLYFERKVVSGTNDSFCNWLVWATGDANRWVFFALATEGRTNSGIRLYKDLQLLARTDDQNTLSSDILNTGEDLFSVGQSWGAGGRFLGDIGMQLAYGRLLTFQEIQNIYLATKWRYQ